MGEAPHRNANPAAPYMPDAHRVARLEQFGLVVEGREFYCTAHPAVRYCAHSDDWVDGFDAGRTSQWGYNVAKQERLRTDDRRVMAACLDGLDGPNIPFDDLRTLYPEPPTRASMLARVRDLARLAAETGNNLPLDLVAPGLPTGEDDR